MCLPKRGTAGISKLRTAWSPHSPLWPVKISDLESHQECSPRCLIPCVSDVKDPSCSVHLHKQDNNVLHIQTQWLLPFFWHLCKQIQCSTEIKKTEIKSRNCCSSTESHIFEAILKHLIDWDIFSWTVAIKLFLCWVFPICLDCVIIFLSEECSFSVLENLHSVSFIYTWQNLFLVDVVRSSSLLSKYSEPSIRKTCWNICKQYPFIQTVSRRFGDWILSVISVESRCSSNGRWSQDVLPTRIPREYFRQCSLLWKLWYTGFSLSPEFN